MFRPSRGVVGALALVAIACSSGDNLVQASNATVRFVNVTDVPLVVTNAGVVDTMNSRLLFGQASGCVFVNLNNTAVPTPTITNGGTGISFTPSLSAGANLLVVGFIGVAGTVQFATLNNSFFPPVNQAGLRFFNGAAGTGLLVMARNGTVLTPFVGLGGSSGFASVPPDSAAITFSNTSSVVFNAGQMAFPVHQASTVFLAPPASQSTPLRVFTVEGC